MKWATMYKSVHKMVTHSKADPNGHDFEVVHLKN